MKKILIANNTDKEEDTTILNEVDLNLSLDHYLQKPQPSQHY
jgi:hypothetical protein